MRQAFFVLSSIDFRQIARRGAPNKAERLFRASISAYCTLTFPSQQETQQLEDLTLPLYPSVSRDTLRFVCAALSECETPPRALVEKLVEEPPEISAPLLVRTQSLSDVDLIALIARKGIGHARVIARRRDLHPAIKTLVAAMERKEASAQDISLQPADAVETTPVAKTKRLADLLPAKAPSHRLGEAEIEIVRKRTAEETRIALRKMMAAPASAELDPQVSGQKLRDAALSGSRELFVATLGDVLRVDRDHASALIGTGDFRALLVALRSLDLPGESAFLLVACAFPNRFPHPVAIRQLLETYKSIELAEARETLRSLRAEALANAFSRHRVTNSRAG